MGVNGEDAEMPDAGVAFHSQDQRQAREARSVATRRRDAEWQMTTSIVVDC